jgi:hypothetical protein
LDSGDGAVPLQILVEAPGPGGYGPNQPTWPSAVIQTLPALGASDVSNNPPGSPGTGFTKSEQSLTFFAGSRKLTSIVLSAGTTLGVTDPHSSSNVLLPSSSARNSVAG